MAGIQNQRQRAGPNEDTPNEARFARQDQGRYSGWSSAIAIIAILIVRDCLSCLPAKVLSGRQATAGPRALDAF
jgi:hypothetical protein